MSHSTDGSQVFSSSYHKFLSTSKPFEELPITKTLMRIAILPLAIVVTGLCKKFEPKNLKHTKQKLVTQKLWRDRSAKELSRFDTAMMTQGVILPGQVVITVLLN